MIAVFTLVGILGAIAALWWCWGLNFELRRLKRTMSAEIEGQVTGRMSVHARKVEERLTEIENRITTVAIAINSPPKVFVSQPIEVAKPLKPLKRGKPMRKGSGGSRK